MRPVEIIALLVAVIALIKIVLLMTQPKSWLPIVKKFYARPLVTMAVSLLTALIILKILLKEITIVQIFAVIGFIMAITMTGMAAYGKEIIAFAENIFKKRSFVARTWPLISVWTILIIWVLVVILD